VLKGFVVVRIVLMLSPNDACGQEDLILAMCEQLLARMMMTKVLEDASELRFAGVVTKVVEEEGRASLIYGFSSF